MKAEIQEYKEFTDILEKFGFEIPNGITIIPFNFDFAESKEKLVYRGSTKSLKKLWRSNNVDVNIIEGKNGKPLYIHQHSAEWIAPTLFLSAALISESPNTVSIALSVIANYVTDLFKGKPPKTEFKMEIIIEDEKDKKYRKLTFEGEPKNTNAIIKMIRELKK